MPHTQSVAGSPPIGSELRYLLLAAQREGNRRMTGELRPLNLTPSQAEVLLVLSEREPLTLAEVGRLIVCETSSPSRIVDALVKRGLVDREPGQIDRRVIYLQLTPRSRELLPTLRRVDADMDTMVTDHLTGEEREAVTAALWKIIGGTASHTALAQRFPQPA